MTKEGLYSFDKKQENNEQISTDNRKFGYDSESVSHAVDIRAGPPDGGWGWMVVLSSFVIHVIADGIVYSFGVFLMEFVDFFHASRGATSWIGALQPGVTLIVGPLASVLTTRYGCRKVTIAGAIIAASGFIGSIWASHLYYLYFTSGIMAGVGFGLIYLPAIVSVAQYFEKKRSFATGLAVCGSGFGTFILAPVTGLLVRKFSWQGAMLILGGLILNVIVCGIIFRPLASLPVPQIKPSHEPDEAGLVNSIDLDDSEGDYDTEYIDLKDSVGDYDTEYIDSKDSVTPRDFDINHIYLKNSDTTKDYKEPLTKTPDTYVVRMEPTTLRACYDNQDNCERNIALLNTQTFKMISHLQKLSILSGLEEVVENVNNFCNNSNHPLTPTRKVKLTGQSSDHTVSENGKSSKDGDESEKSTTHYTRIQDVSIFVPSQSSVSEFHNSQTELYKLQDSDSHAYKTELRETQSIQRSLFGAQQSQRSVLKSQHIHLSALETRSTPRFVREPSKNEVIVPKPRKIFAIYTQSDSALNHSVAVKPLLRTSVSSPKCSPFKTSQSSSHDISYPSASLNRKDIFYRGSLTNIPMFRSKPELYKVIMSTLPDQDSDSISEITSKKYGRCLNFLRAFRNIFSEMLSFKLLKNPVFLMFAISNFFTSLGFNIPFIFLPDRAKLAGIDENSATLLLSVIGLANTAGRIFFGYLSDRPCVNRLLLYSTALAICGVVTALSPSVGGDYNLLVTYAAIFGLSTGVYVSLTSVVLVDLLGLDYLTNSFGLLLLFQGAATFVGPPAAGWLCDWTGSYDISFVLMGTLIALSGSMLYFLPLVQRYSERSSRMECILRDIELGKKPVTNDDMDIISTEPTSYQI